MLIKRSSKNQIVLPKAVLERAELGPEDLYFNIEYHAGRIILTPMQLDEKIPPETLKQFEKASLTREPGDRTYSSMQDALKDLKR